MASPRTLSLLICGAVLLLAWPASAQRGGERTRGRQISWPVDSQPPDRPVRPGGSTGGNTGGGSGEFWPGAGPPASGGSTPSGGEFWPGAGPGTGTSTTTRRPGGSGSGCACPSTPEYNPVCGTDGVSYGNPGKLNCARLCGRTVSILHYGNCTPADPNAPSTSSTTTPSTTTRRRGRRQ